MNTHFRVVSYQKAHHSPKWDSPLKSLKEPIKINANRQEAQNIHGVQTNIHKLDYST